MYLALHGCSIMHTNIVTDIDIAKEVGYDGVEIWAPKLERYLDVGYQVEDLLGRMEELRVSMISPMYGIERQDAKQRGELTQRCERLAKAAKTLGCPVLQAIAMDPTDWEWPVLRSRVASSLAELADIAATFGVRVGLEPVAVAPLRTLKQALEVIEAANRENISLVVDLFHLWAAGTSWEEIAALDASIIANAHIGDATEPKSQDWTDDDRAALPGDGIMPLKEGIDALRRTGFDGTWSVEVWSPYHWEWNPIEVARELKRRADELLKA